VVSDIRFVSERTCHPCLRALGQNIVNHAGVHAKRRSESECRTVALMTCAKYAVNTKKNPYICCGPWKRRSDTTKRDEWPSHCRSIETTRKRSVRLGQGKESIGRHGWVGQIQVMFCRDNRHSAPDRNVAKGMQAYSTTKINLLLRISHVNPNHWCSFGTSDDDPTPSPCCGVTLSSGVTTDHWPRTATR